MKRNWIIVPDWDNLNTCVSLAKEYDLAFEYNDFFMPNVYINEEEIEKRIEKYLSLDRDRSKDTLHGVFYDIYPLSMDPIIRNHSRNMMIKSLDIAKRLGCRGVVFHTGILAGLKLKSYQKGWVKGSLQLFQELCSAYPMLDIYLENTTEAEPDLLVELAALMKDYKNFKLCLDYAHAYLTTTSLEDWVKAFSPYLGHIHLNDNNGIEDLHQAPGEGNMDYGKFFNFYDRYMKDIPILLELHGIEDTIKAIEYMKNRGEV